MQATAAAVAVGALHAEAPPTKTPKPKKVAASKPKKASVAAGSAPTNSRSALTLLVAMSVIAIPSLLGWGFVLYQYSEGNIFNGTPSTAAEQAQENPPVQAAEVTDETDIDGDASAGNQGNKQTNKKRQAANNQASNTDDEKPKEQEPSNSAQCAEFYNRDNFQRAFEPCLAAAKGGDSAAYFRVAFIYDTEKGDFDNAKTWYKKSAEAGNTKAMYNLGYINHVEYEDYPNAIKWYREAANRGNVKAMNNLGVIYFDIEENFDEGCRWYKKASDKGNKSGRNNYNDFCT
jgi:TPR repeat protein